MITVSSLELQLALPELGHHARQELAKAGKRCFHSFLVYNYWFFIKVVVKLQILKSKLKKFCGCAIN